MAWLDNGEIIADIGEFISEDLGRGDITTNSTVPKDVRGWQIFGKGRFNRLRFRSR